MEILRKWKKFFTNGIKQRKRKVDEIDMPDIRNECAVVEYIDDLYKFYKEQEFMRMPVEYMDKQVEINPISRAILVDWIIKFHDKFELMLKTLYLSICIVDRFLSMEIIPRGPLPLVGIASMLIACKYEELRPARELIHGVPPAADKKLETRWSELNPDLLRLVARNLGDISNVVRFRVVCKHWRSAVSLSDLPSQLPWFLELVTGRLRSDIKFYSLYSNKTYTVHVPEAHRKLVEGPSESYLLLKDDIRSTPILVNPISRHQLRPPYLNPDGTDCRELIKRTACCGRTATFYKGNLYHYCFETDDIKVIDIHKNISTIPGKFDFCHLVNAYDDLLAVVRENWFTDEWRYKVYRLEQGGKTPFWAEMSQGIGDRVIFIDNDGGLCLKSSDFDGLEGNKIYCHRGILFDYHCLVIYDLEKETKQVICPIEMFGTWFVPSF